MGPESNAAAGVLRWLDKLYSMLATRIVVPLSCPVTETHRQQLLEPLISRSGGQKARRVEAYQKGTGPCLAFDLLLHQVVPAAVGI